MASSASFQYPASHNLDPGSAKASLDSCLSLDFGPFETIHRWRKMPECAEFVGARRSKHTAVAYKESVYIFGGDDGNSMLNDLLRFSCIEKSWTRAFSTGTPPAPRYHHSAVVSNESMFIFGGYTGDINSNQNLTNRNDLWEYRFTTGQWSQWRYGGSKKPVARSAHGAAVHQSHLYIFAGYDGNCRLSDMWRIQLKPNSPDPQQQSTHKPEWQEVVYTGENPPTCCNFPVAVSGDYMYVFSGQSGVGGSGLFQFSFLNSSWTRISTEHILRDAPLPPGRRYGHTMIAFASALYVFGGAADNNYDASLHCFDLDSRTWSLATHTLDSDVPSGRLFHSAAVVGDAMYIFGGSLDNNHFRPGNRSGEMFRFQLSAFPKCTLEDDYEKLLRSKQFYDVDFIAAGGAIVSAHSAVVAARSKWLRNKLVEAIKERGPVDKMSHLKVKLEENTNEKAFQFVLDFIYTDKIDPTGDRRELMASNSTVHTMMQVYILAVTFQMERLANLIRRFIESQVNADNVLKALMNANRLGGLEFIKEYCFKFVTKESNYCQIVMSKEFETLDRDLMVEVIRRKQCPDLAGTKSTSCNLLPEPDLVPPDPLGDFGGSSLRQDLKRFLDSSQSVTFADISLNLGADAIPSHKAILAARSSYFEGLFRSFNPPDDKIIITIGDMVPSRLSFLSLLRYVYYGEVQMPPEDSLYLLSAPSFYIFSNNRLQVYCKLNLERNVTVENVIQILLAADKSQVQDMKKYALRIIVRHFAKVAKQPRIRGLSKELLLDIVDALGEEMTDNRFPRDALTAAAAEELNWE